MSTRNFASFKAEITAGIATYQSLAFDNKLFGTPGRAFGHDTPFFGLRALKR